MASCRQTGEPRSLGTTLDQVLEPSLGTLVRSSEGLANRRCRAGYFERPTGPLPAYVGARSITGRDASLPVGLFPPVGRGPFGRALKAVAEGGGTSEVAEGPQGGGGRLPQ